MSEPDFDNMDYENALQDFQVEYLFFDENGNEDYDTVKFTALDADQAGDMFAQRFANDITEIRVI